MCVTRVIQGHDGPLAIDEAKRTVTKTYLNCRHEDAVQKAEREVAYASRLLDAFSRADGLSCPRILAWEPSFPPRVVMQLCPGEALSRYLRRAGTPDTRIAEIAQRIHAGLEIYTRLFGEAYYDCSFPNILYDEPTRVLTFLDFGLPRPIDGPEWSTLEASLGNLVGWACYDLARPSRLWLPKQGYLNALQAILSAFAGEISSEHVRDAAQAVFGRLGGAGSTLRRRYYRNAGAIIAAPCLRRLCMNSLPGKPAGSFEGNVDSGANIAA